jgi:membrane fusion protein, multidrug efflux system
MMSLRTWLMLLAMVCLVAVALWWWADRRRFERTDNAYVQADILQVGALSEGRLVEITAIENQRVARGDILARVDPADARLAIERSLAELAAQRATVRTAESTTQMQAATVEEREAALRAAEADRDLAAAELARLRPLAAKGWVSTQRLQVAEVDAAKSIAAVRQARAALQAADHAATAAIASRDEASARVVVADQSLRRLDRDLSLTEVRAPAAGVIANVSARLGQRAELGRPLFAIVPDQGRYIVANLKETQIARIRPGQEVTIRADALGNRDFRGVVQGLSPATGSQFALIPVEAASGTFTRVVQRVPVRIRLSNLTDYVLLRPGMSLDVAIRVAP